MTHVYRPPFLYAQRRVARVEWQPQPLWSFTGVSEEWVLTEYVGTIGFYTENPIIGISDSFILTEYVGDVGVQVPSVVPMSESGARFLLEQAGFVVTTINDSSPYIAFGDVISTYPVGGTYAAYGSTVMLTVSIGTQRPGEHGAGFPVDWNYKRRKRTLKQQPQLHLKKILDKTGREVLKTKPKKPKLKVKAIKLWP